MLTSLHIRNFRGFRDLRIQPLKRINLLTGENNTGKTGILEALQLLLASNLDHVGRLPSAFRANQSSADDFKSFWEWLFWEKDLTVLPEIIGNQRSGRAMECRLKYQPNQQPHVDIYHDKPVVQGSPNFSISSGSSGGGDQKRPRFLVQSTRLGNPVDDAELYNRVSLTAAGEEKILDLMRVIEPRLQKLRYSRITSQPLVYAHLGFKHFVPATQMGQGFSRLLTLFCEMMVAEAKFLLIDEIENGLHYSVLSEIWKGVGAIAAAENIQVFATTHSWGCIVAAHEAFTASDRYDFALHRLQRVNDRLEVVTYDREMLETSLRAELEVR